MPDSTRNREASRDHNQAQSILLSPRQKASLGILNDFFEEESEPKTEKQEFTKVS